MQNDVIIWANLMQPRFENESLIKYLDFGLFFCSLWSMKRTLSRYSKCADGFEPSLVEYEVEVLYHISLHRNLKSSTVVIDLGIQFLIIDFLMNINNTSIIILYWTWDNSNFHLRGTSHGFYKRKWSQPFCGSPELMPIMPR